jgi:ribosomal protein S18 acetylase RimI-like enzyme
MIRPTIPADTSALVQLAQASGAFTPAEVDDLRDRLDAYPDRHALDGHQALTCEQEGRPTGLAYYAPVAMTERTWSMYWLVVARTPEGTQAGADLLRHTEDDARHRGARMLVAETSSRPGQEPARLLYAAHGYEVGATLPDFYADGDDQVIYRKLLVP